jgi:long-subunit acyl-CoA synthetase (AMP-forming)
MALHYVTVESGQPVGAVFDHAQGVAAWRNMRQWFSFNDDDAAFTLVSWSNPPSLLVGLHYFLSGISNALADEHDNVIENMQQVSPTVMLDIPYTWERLYEGYISWITHQPESSQDVFRWAVAKAKEYRAAGSNASARLRQEYQRADMTFFREFRGRIGGRMRRLYSVGASLPQELAEFLRRWACPCSTFSASPKPAASPPSAAPAKAAPTAAAKWPPAISCGWPRMAKLWCTANR